MCSGALALLLLLFRAMSSFFLVLFFHLLAACQTEAGTLERCYLMTYSYHEQFPWVKPEVVLYDASMLHVPSGREK